MVLQTEIPGKLRFDLRTSSDTFVRRRRSIVGLCFFSCAVLGTIALYQIGILKKLPQPKSRAFSSEEVNGSMEAYSIISTPDAFLGLASYSVTACLAAFGDAQRWRSQPIVVIGMALKLALDAAYAAKLTIDECVKFRSFSLWSLFAASATFATIPLMMPEVKAAYRQLSNKS